LVNVSGIVFNREELGGSAYLQDVGSPSVEHSRLKQVIVVTITEVNDNITSHLTVTMTVNTGHTVRLDVVTSNTVFGKVQRVSAEREVEEVASRGSTEGNFSNTRQTGTGALSEGHISILLLGINVPTYVDWNHIEWATQFTLLSFSITDGNDSATRTYVSGSLESLNDLISKVISSGRAIAFWDVTLNPEDTLIVHLRIKATNSRFPECRDKTGFNVGLASGRTKAQVLPSNRGYAIDRTKFHLKGCTDIVIDTSHDYLNLSFVFV
jgi:hypothetical protein